jgi:hypothetical protein
VSRVDELPAIGLPELLERAALQSRFDRKYVVAEETVDSLLSRIGDRFLALEMDGRRRFRYESVYFDTRELMLYHDHRRGRRRRWKARTRSYLDSGQCLFEVKVQGRRAATVKERLPHLLARRSELTAEAQAFLADRLAHHYAEAPPPLEAVLSTSYRRATLAAREGTLRVTLDFGLCCAGAGGRHVRAPDGRVLVEVKSAAPRTAVDRALRDLGAREVSMSKYCLATAMLDPSVPANRWSRVLRQWLGRERS